MSLSAGQHCAGKKVSLDQVIQARLRLSKYYDVVQFMRPKLWAMTDDTAQAYCSHSLTHKCWRRSAKSASTKAFDQRQWA